MNAFTITTTGISYSTVIAHGQWPVSVCSIFLLQCLTLLSSAGWLSRCGTDKPCVVRWLSVLLSVDRPPPPRALRAMHLQHLDDAPREGRCGLRWQSRGEVPATRNRRKAQLSLRAPRAVVDTRPLLVSSARLRAHTHLSVHRAIRMCATAWTA